MKKKSAERYIVSTSFRLSGAMVLILYSNLEIAAHVRSDLAICSDYGSCLNQSQIFFFQQKDVFPFIRAQHVLNNHLM